MRDEEALDCPLSVSAPSYSLGLGGPGCSAIDPRESVVPRHDDGHQRGGRPRRRGRRGRRSRSPSPPEQQQQEAAERSRGRGRRRGTPSSPGDVAHPPTAAAPAASSAGCRSHDDADLPGAPFFGAATAAAADGRDVIDGGDGSAVAMGAAQPQSARDVRGRDGHSGD